MSLYQSGTSKTLTGSYWILNVGPVEVHKTVENKTETTRRNTWYSEYFCKYWVAAATGLEIKVKFIET